MKLPIVLSLLFSLNVFAEADKIVFGENGPSASTEKNGGGLIVSVEWLKHKKTKKIDMAVVIENKYDKPVFFRDSAVKLKFLGETGKLKGSSHAFELSPESRQKETLVFNLPDAPLSGGKATLEISPIREGDFDKPGKDLTPIKLELDIPAVNL
jgi:hypothetical protein